MKILWISHLLPFPPKGGVLIRSYNNLKEISKYHEVNFIGLYQTAHQPEAKSVEDAEKNIKKICKRVIVLPFESFQSRIGWYFLVIKSFFRFMSYKEAWCRSKKMTTEIKHFLEKEHIDLVHFDTISLLQYYNVIPPGIPIAINHHNVESHMVLRRSYAEGNWLLRLYTHLEALKLRRLEKKYCSKGVNLVVSELDRDRLIKIVPGSRISVIANGVDIGYFQRVHCREVKNSIVFVGGLKWYPNIDAMMFFFKEVWPLLVRRVKSVVFFIIGSNPSEDLKRISKDDPRIQLKGFVDDIRPIMSSATCYVCPMRVGGGTRLKVLDALAMGVPLIATRIACEGINVKDNENVLLSETPEEFLEKILMVFNNRLLQEKLRRNSRKLVEREYDYNKIGIRLKECYVNELKLRKNLG